MFSKFIHVVACIRASFFFNGQIIFIVCLDHKLFIHPTADGHLGGFHFSPFMKVMKCYELFLVLDVMKERERGGFFYRQKEDEKKICGGRLTNLLK